MQGTDSSVWMSVFVWDRFADDDTVLRFFSKLTETNPDASTTDKVRWKLNSNGCFTVRYFYMKLLNLNYSAMGILAVRGRFPLPAHLEGFGACQGVVLRLGRFTWEDFNY